MSANGLVQAEIQRRGEAQSVADEESGITGLRARTRGGKEGRWWPVRLARRGWWDGEEQREAVEEGKGESYQRAREL